MADRVHEERTDVARGEEPAAPLFTIFTPSYNRAHTLGRVYDCLRAQTLRDFEWLVIDDGSTDSTAERVAGWTAEAGFPIRYLRQEHAGKHVAHNRALIEARGRFFAPLDSDDALLPDALATLMRVWHSIPADERDAFYGVDALCCDPAGKIIGDRYPRDPLDANLRELKYIYRLRGEKWGVGLTEIVRRYPFPEIAGASFIPEGIVWLNLAKRYKSRCVNEIVRIYYVDDAGTGPTLSKRMSLGDHALGRWHYYLWLLNNDLGYFRRAPVPFLKAAAMLPVVGWCAGKSLSGSLGAVDNRAGRLLVLAVLPAAALLWSFDRLSRPRAGQSVPAVSNAHAP